MLVYQLPPQISPPLSSQPPHPHPTPKSANFQSHPSFQTIPPFISVFCKLPLKVGFFSERPKYQSISPLTPSYLLKVSKFLDDISQFEFLFMTEKNIFVYKLFLSQYISDFALFFCKNCVFLFLHFLLAKLSTALIL